MSWNYRIIHDTSGEDERWYVAEFYEEFGAFTENAVKLEEFADEGVPDEYQDRTALKSLRWQVEHVPLAFDKPIIHWDGKTRHEPGPERGDS